MSEHDAIIERLAGLVGVSAEYIDIYGQKVSTPLEGRRAILRDFGLPTESEAQARDSLAMVERWRNALVPALIPAEAGRATRVAIRRPAGAEAATWRITDESGAVQEGRAPFARFAEGFVLALPRLAPGYHRLSVEAGGERAAATIIAAPPRCWQPRDFAEGARHWGLAAQLYSLRSADNLGIGTYADAGAAAAEAGRLGASFVGLSPVHSLFSADRTKISPYSPSSRLFLETLHIDPAAIPGFAGGEAARLYDAHRERIAELRDTALVDHVGVWSVLAPILEAAWAERGGRDDAEVARFRRDLGEPLDAHATFEALSEHFSTQGASWVGQWPEDLRQSGSPAVRRFAADHADRIRFHTWLQWLADRQLGDAAARGRDAGMAIGLYRDLAVGADRAGSEVWATPERFGLGLSIGAPPDLLAPQGQDWGLPPFNPLVLEREGLAAFRALTTANMRHAGAIRVDHAFQLARLFLIPVGASAAMGAYVTYPFEALLAMLRLESHRARCLVIAEDLGTGPDGFSDAIMRAGVLSYRVLPFERNADGGFKNPAGYPHDALSVITTHDLPTFVGWWRGLDIDLRQTLGIYDRERGDRERHDRVVERQRLTEALHAEKLVTSPEPPDAPPFEAVVRYLARTPCVLNAVQYEDVVGELNQPNMPGISDGQHPNWRRKLVDDLDTIAAPGGPLAKMASAIASEGRGPRKASSALAAPPPRATYRLQFHKDFTFDDAAAIVPYLARLGISHLYASPIHRARPGSTHGYDIVDHSELNPELGGEEGFRRLSDTLKEHGLGLILDIVPNHMGVGGADNPWWLSVLEWGPLSPSAAAFDIDWERLGAQHRLVVPFLGDRYGDALEKGDLRLAFDAAEGGFSVWHFEHRFPVCPLSFPIVLDRALAALDDVATDGPEILAVSERLRVMDGETTPERRAAFPQECEQLKRRIADAVAASPALAKAVERAVTLVNGVPGFPESFGTLHRILEAQSYRLAHWRVAASDINYRRFFDINSLAGLRVEVPQIFAGAHEAVFRLVREGRIDGLRIDHIDGLADPAGYVRALQSAVGPGFYVVVEKILEPGEKLRPWAVAGTTGYDVMNLIDGIFVETAAAPAFDQLYRRISGTEPGYGTLLRAAKTEILESSFASELEVLVSDLKRIADADRRTRDFAVNAIRRALVEIVARFPVYRSYLDNSGTDADDLRLIEETIAKAKRRSALPDRTIHDFVADALLGRIETEGPGRPEAELPRRFRRRFQQLTGPVMAKSLEDTLFYRYVPLVSLNEVGGDPGHFGLPVEAFHREMTARARDWPNAMIATATHDTKRGEDARSRISALSELPDLWADSVGRFHEMVRPHVVTVDESDAPDANDKYLLLQSLLGAWPHELLGDTSGGAVKSFRQRMKEYASKAMREAKRHTSWVNNNEAYETATFELIDRLVQPGSDFLETFRPLARRLAFSGMLTGLSRTVLKCTLPGVPDTYQGTEFWDLSLVDPDNRRPVDYAERLRGLESEEPWRSLLDTWHDGRVKQRLLSRLLADRAAAPGFYAGAEYQPLPVKGPRAANVVAFRRSLGPDDLIVVVPRCVAALIEGEVPPLGAAFWQDTAVLVPAGPRRNVIADHDHAASGGEIPLAELLADLPIAVLRTAS